MMIRGLSYDLEVHNITIKTVITQCFARALLRVLKHAELPIDDIFTCLVSTKITNSSHNTRLGAYFILVWSRDYEFGTAYNYKIKP